jgi:hypothetical protein
MFRIVFGLLLLTSCAKTSINTFRDPSAPTETNYNRMLVYAAIPDIGGRKRIETAFIDKLTAHGVTGIPSMEIYLPTRTYTGAEMVQLLDDNKIDSLLIITLTDKYIDTNITSSTTTELNVMENKFEKVARVQSYKTPHLYFLIKLLDVKNDSMVWVASTHTKESVSTTGMFRFKAGFGKLISSLADTTIQQLQQEGFIE